MRPAPALALLLLAGGCAAADTGGYPSLRPRAAERQGFDEPAVAAPAPPAADPALDAELRGLEERLRQIADGYAAGEAKVRRAAAAPGTRTVGSDAWLDAQTALAGLDDWHAQATGLASELEGLAGDRLARVGAPYPPLDALQRRAADEATRESAGIAALGATLPTP